MTTKKQTQKTVPHVWVLEEKTSKGTWNPTLMSCASRDQARLTKRELQSDYTPLRVAKYVKV